jgi:hypothetical protein
MTKEEAIQEMRAGKKVTHRYFSPEEWVTMGTEGQIVLEDGVECSPEEFWQWRTDDSYKTDWELWKK